MLAYKKIEKKNWYQLLTFFTKNKDTEFFDPFPLNKKSVEAIIADKKNLYIGIFSGETIIGFGMLRWYKDFKAPTLGLLIDKNYRGSGLGNELYSYLIVCARLSKCPAVIAIVHKANIASLKAAKKSGMVKLKQLSLGDEYDFTKYNSKDKVILIKRLYA